MIKMLDKYTCISIQKVLETHVFGIPFNIFDYLPNISNNYYPKGYSLNSSFLISQTRMTFTRKFNVTKYGGVGGGGGGGTVFV
jgi:hypothetical protein